MTGQVAVLRGDAHIRPYYQADGITLYHGDCLEILPQLTADAVITDPPYGVGVKYGPAYNDRRADYWPWFQRAVETMRAAAPLVAFTHRVAALKHLQGWDWLGIWHKPMATAGLIQLPVMPHWEPIFLYGITGRSDLPRRFDVFTANSATARAFEHPTPKPLGLFIELVQWLVPHGGTVIDPFAGGGTTLRAAKDLGRQAIGIEIEERWCELAVKRLAQGTLWDGSNTPPDLLECGQKAAPATRQRPGAMADQHLAEVADGD